MRLIAPLLLSLFFLQACSSHSPEPSPKPDAGSEAGLSIRPGYKVGIPYSIKGRRFIPAESFTYAETGTASWYGENFHGRLTANGEIYDMYAMTAAHKTLQLPAIVRVTNLKSGKSLIVRINDRGPFIGERIIDLSKGAAEALGFQEQGLAPVRVEVMPEASQKLRDMARQRAMVRDMDTMVAALNTGSGVSPSLASAEPPAVPPARPPAARPPAAVQVASAPAVPVPEGSWFLQAASFGDPANAHRAKTRLLGVGSATVVPRTRGDRTLYVVRVGPYADKETAQSALERIRKVGFDDALLVASG